MKTSCDMCKEYHDKLIDHDLSELSDEQISVIVKESAKVCGECSVFCKDTIDDKCKNFKDGFVLSLSSFKKSKSSGSKVSKVSKMTSKDLNLPVVVMVKANWCGHCKHTFPEFEKAGRKDFRYLEETDQSQKDLFVKMKELMGSGFTGFPTIVKIKDGKIIEYFKGERIADNFKKF